MTTVENGSVPVPDPTKLTADAVNQSKSDLRREMAALRELIEARVAAAEGILGALGVRVMSMPDELGALRNHLRSEIEEQLVVLRAADEHLVTEIKEHVDNLQLLHGEKFAAIQQQFRERDVRTEQDKKSSKEALDAALLAQKESVRQQNDANTTAATKSEVSFTKQTDQLVILIATLEKSLTDRITELKERIDRGEGGNAGQSTERTEHRLNIGQALAAISVVLLSVSLVVSTLIIVFHK